MDNVLHTARLVLRPVTAGDHAVLLAHWAAPGVRRFLFDGAMLSAADITEAIEDSTRDFGRAGYGLWLIHEKDGTDLVGATGLRPLEDLGLEIFYSLAPGSWGKGYPGGRGLRTFYPEMMAGLVAAAEQDAAQSP